MTAPTLRRTSQYTLTVPAPEHADADLHAALDSLIYSALQADAVVTGSWITRDALPRPTLHVSWRSSSDETAREDALRVLSAYAAADPADAGLHTGYGHHRRDFPVIP